MSRWSLCPAVYIMIMIPAKKLGSVRICFDNKKCRQYPPCFVRSQIGIRCRLHTRFSEKVNCSPLKDETIVEPYRLGVWIRFVPQRRMFQMKDTEQRDPHSQIYGIKEWFCCTVTEAHVLICRRWNKVEFDQLVMSVLYSSLLI